MKFNLTKTNELENIPAEIICASQVEVKEVSWLWKGYIPFGKITLLQGDPGDGKSTFVLNLAAMLTSGKPLPFCDESIEPMKVIYQTTEDDIEDTVVPRFIKAGGNPDNLLFINEKDKMLTFTDNRIPDTIRKTNAKLLILDPLSSYIGGDVSLNMANDVRSQFNPLIQTAKETGCAIIIVGHLNKMQGAKSLYRSLGSIDVVGAARSTLLIGRTSSERPSERMMVIQKSNLAPTGTGVVFNIDELGIEWIEERAATADELFCEKTGAGRPNVKYEKAKEILTNLLSDGGKPQSEIMLAMENENISRSTVFKAKSEIGAVSRKVGSSWEWFLPEPDGSIIHDDFIEIP
ncbi:MAG: AAA family ATPase [Clostridia bacterium]|nr:AAA family ATPase [Clostridia bacterium]